MTSAMVSINDTPKLRISQLTSCHERVRSYAQRMGKRAVKREDEKPLNEFAVAFGARLKETRLAKNPAITGDALGAQIGATKTNVSHWETGKHMPDLETLAAICNVLGCSADSLLGRDERVLSAAAMAEAKAFDALPPEDQKKWRAMRLALFTSLV